eukprot:365158-Chlamydomonas_euryale.AAC.4
MSVDNSSWLVTVSLLHGLEFISPYNNRGRLRALGGMPGETCSWLLLAVTLPGLPACGSNTHNI